MENPSGPGNWKYQQNEDQRYGLSVDRGKHGKQIGIKEKQKMLCDIRPMIGTSKCTGDKVFLFESQLYLERTRESLSEYKE